MKPWPMWALAGLPTPPRHRHLLLPPNARSRSAEIATTAPAAEAIKPWGRVSTGLIPIANTASVLLPYFNNGVVLGIPGTANWKSSASNEQDFEVFYDLAITPAIRLIPGYQHIGNPLAAQVTKGTTQADVFLTRFTVAWRWPWVT